MNQHEIEATIAFRKHESDICLNECERFVAAVEKILGHDLDGDQDTDGYSIDLCVDFFDDGISAKDAASEFSVLKYEARNQVQIG